MADTDQTVRTTALVVSAISPPQTTVWPFRTKDWVYVVADHGSGPAQMRAIEHLDNARWLIPGCLIEIDAHTAGHHPLHPFAIDWTSVTPIGDRVAAQDPALVDPIAARDRALSAWAAASPLTNAPRDGFVFHPNGTLSAPASALAQAVADSERLPARDGMVRGIGVIVAWRQVVDKTLGTPGNPLGQDLTHVLREWSRRGNEAVMSVNIHARAPYARFIRRFKVPNGLEWRGWLPLQVSALNPEDVWVEWQEIEAAGGIPAGATIAGATIGAAATATPAPTIASAVSGGMPGQMTITSVEPTDQRAQGYAVAKMGMDITPDGSQTYHLEQLVAMPPDRAELVKPGLTLPVTIDPNDREHMTAHWDQAQAPAPDSTPGGSSQ